MIFTDKGRCYWLKVHEIPEGGRTAKGKSINSLISKGAEETIAAFMAVPEFNEKQFVFMVSAQGMIKKVALSEFSNPRRTGIVATGLKKGDLLKDVKLTDGSLDVIVGTRNGLAIRFHENEVRVMGRSASGVRGIKLGKGDVVVGVVTLRRRGTTILVATEKGYGKRSEEGEYRISHRGGKGIITVKTSEKTGKMVVIREVVETDDIVVVTSNGMVIRQHASDIRVAGRNTQGVRLIRLQADDEVADVAAVMAEEEEERQLAEAVRSSGNGMPAGNANGGGTSRTKENDGKNGKKKAGAGTVKEKPGSTPPAKKGKPEKAQKPKPPTRRSGKKKKQ